MENWEYRGIERRSAHPAPWLAEERRRGGGGPAVLPPRPRFATAEAIRQLRDMGRRPKSRQVLKPGKKGVSRYRNLAPRGLSSPVREVMTSDPETCRPSTPLKALARMMIEADCGAIPVIDEKTSTPIGIVTDRDIVCRAVAEKDDLSDATAAECMTSPVHVLRPTSTLKECCDLMEETQIHRVVVVDENERCCGILSTSDIVKNVEPAVTAELLNDICEPIDPASREDTREA